MTQKAAESNQIIDVREAVRIARDRIKYVFADEAISNLQLEEVELSEDEKYWYVTIGFDTQRLVQESDPLEIGYSFRKPKYVRDYKVVTIRASDGEVKSINIRQI